MTVYFIGAGPGALDLLTVRATQIISRCGTCIYAGSIVPEEFTSLTAEGSTIINSARLPLATITEHMIHAHQQGHDIARLHSGDTSLYSAIGEQVAQLEAAGIDYEFVPGVSAYSAAAAALGTELTSPAIAQSVILTRVSSRSTAMPAGEHLDEITSSQATTVIHLAAKHIEQVVRQLLTRFSPSTPAAVCAFVSRDNEQILRGTLATIADQVTQAQITRTAVIIVGHALATTPHTAKLYGCLETAASVPSFLYSDSRPRDEHGRTICENSTLKIHILGGTREARDLAELLVNQGHQVITSLAGRVTSPALPAGEVRIGGFGGVEGLSTWHQRHGIQAVVDATHPFAEQISSHAQRSSQHTKIPLLRVHRPAWTATEQDQWIEATSAQDAADIVSSQWGEDSVVLVTIGRQHAHAFAHCPHQVVMRCVEEPDTVLAARCTVILDRGPFTVENEVALMTTHKVNVVVTKNSGGTLTSAKLEAARILGIPVVMIQRPPQPPHEFTYYSAAETAQAIAHIMTN